MSQVSEPTRRRVGAVRDDDLARVLAVPHAHATAVGGVVDRAVRIQREVAYVRALDVDQPAIDGPADYAGRPLRLEHFHEHFSFFSPKLVLLTF